MAGTNMYAIKRHLFAWLGAAPELQDIQVAYVWPGASLDREVVFGGKPTADQHYSAMTSGRKPRDERALVVVHIQVTKPGFTVEETDARVEEIGAVLETMLADNPALGGAIPGLRYGGIERAETDFGADDDAVESTLTYHIAFSSRLL